MTAFRALRGVAVTCWGDQTAATLTPASGVWQQRERGGWVSVRYRADKDDVQHDTSGSWHAAGSGGAITRESDTVERLLVTLAGATDQFVFEIASMAYGGNKYSHTVELIETDAAGAVADLRTRCAGFEENRLTTSGLATLDTKRPAAGLGPAARSCRAHASATRCGTGSEYAEAHLYLALWQWGRLGGESKSPAHRELYWDLYLDWLTDALDMSYREVVSAHHRLAVCCLGYWPSEGGVGGLELCPSPVSLNRRIRRQTP